MSFSQSTINHSSMGLIDIATLATWLVLFSFFCERGVRSDVRTTYQSHPSRRVHSLGRFHCRILEIGYVPRFYSRRQPPALDCDPDLESWRVWFSDTSYIRHLTRIVRLASGLRRHCDHQEWLSTRLLPYERQVQS